MVNSGFAHYRRKELAELRPYVPGEPMERITISPELALQGSPKPGDMIARNPANHKDQWLLSAEYFAANFEAVDEHD